MPPLVQRPSLMQWGATAAATATYYAEVGHAGLLLLPSATATIMQWARWDPQLDPGWVGPWAGPGSGSTAGSRWVGPRAGPGSGSMGPDLGPDLGPDPRGAGLLI